MGNICLEKDISNEKKQKMNLLSQMKENYGTSIYQSFQREEQWESWMIFENGEKNLLIDKQHFHILYEGYNFYQDYYRIVWEDIDLKKVTGAQGQRQIQGQLEYEQAVQAKARSLDEVFLNSVKYIIRRGEPLTFFRPLLMKMFSFYRWSELESDFKIQKSVIFQGKTTQNIKVVPTFSDKTDLRLIVKVSTLSSEGRDAMHRILWLLKENILKVENLYNPMIPQIISILLQFAQEFEVYNIIKFLIDYSMEALKDTLHENQNTRVLRWHFSLTQKQFLQSAKSFIDLAENRSSAFKNVHRHMESVGFSLFRQFITWCESMFFGVLQYHMVLRIVLIFLNEGIRTLFKISYGIVIKNTQGILQSKTKEQISSLLKNFALKYDTSDNEDIIQQAYKLKIRKTPKNMKQMRVSSLLAPLNQRILYRPRVDSSYRQLISYEKFEVIWEFIPNIYRLQNPVQIFSTQKNGFSIASMMRVFQGYDIGTPLLILAQTEFNSIFGIFCDHMIHPNHKNGQYYGSDDTFVFTLAPKEMFFESVNLNHDFISAGNDHFAIGSNKPAVYLKSDLTGFSEYCDTFSSTPLHAKDDEHLQQIMQGKSDFKIINLECYTLGV